MSITFTTGVLWGDCANTFPKNQEWINMSNRNGMIVLEALGMPCSDEDYCGTFNLNHFLGLASSWLQKNIGKQDPGFETKQNGNFIDCGIPEGYVNNRVLQLVVLAQEGKASGADLLLWS